MSGRSVILVGPEGVGKSAIIRSLTLTDVMVVDPFERVSAQRASRIRRAMDRGVTVVAAARTLNRASVGQVGRIVWRFTTIRVPPLSDTLMRRVIADDCVTKRIPAALITSKWIRHVAKIARGRPGIGLTIVSHAAAMCDGRRLPVPAAAYLEAGVQRASKGHS